MATASVTRQAIPIREAPVPCREPALDELLSDPIVVAMMRADGVDQVRLKAMLNRLAGELQARRAPFVFLPPGVVPDEPGEATPGVATRGVATPGVATPGVASPGADPAFRKQPA